MNHLKDIEIKISILIYLLQRGDTAAAFIFPFLWYLDDRNEGMVLGELILLLSPSPFSIVIWDLFSEHLSCRQKWVKHISKKFALPRILFSAIPCHRCIFMEQRRNCFVWLYFIEILNMSFWSLKGFWKGRGIDGHSFCVSWQHYGKATMDLISDHICWDCLLLTITGWTCCQKTRAKVASSKPSLFLIFKLCYS